MNDKARARWAGWLYVLVIVAGVAAEFGARGQVVVRGDAQATIQALVAHIGVYRIGLALKVGYLVAYLMAGLLLLDLLGQGSALARKFGLGILIMASAVEAANLIVYAAPLYLLDPAAGLAPDQVQALGYAALRLFGMGFTIALTYFGVFCIVIAMLIAKSGRMPLWLGGLMGLAGICYLISGLRLFLDFSLPAPIDDMLNLPCLIGESALALWLVVRGVSAPKSA